MVETNWDDILDGIIPIQDEKSSTNWELLLSHIPHVKASPGEEETRDLREQIRPSMEQSWMPRTKAALARAGLGVAAPVTRFVLGDGKTANSMNRMSDAYEQLASEYDQNSVIPPVIARGLRGAGATLPTMVGAGMLAGPAGSIAAAGIQEADQAITEGVDAGLSNKDVAKYAAVQGGIEVALASVLQGLGHGGLESVAGGKVATKGFLDSLKQYGKSTVIDEALLEEIPTEYFHLLARKANVDPSKMTAEEVGKVIGDTFVQTLLTGGMLQGPDIAKHGFRKVTGRMSEEQRQALPSQYVQQNLDENGALKPEAEALLASNSPSRTEWEAAGLPPKTSTGYRAQFVQQARQIIAERQNREPGGPGTQSQAQTGSEAQTQQEGLQEPPGTSSTPSQARADSTDAESMINEKAKSGPVVSKSGVELQVGDIVRMEGDVPSRSSQITEIVNDPKTGESKVRVMDSVTKTESLIDPGDVVEAQHAPLVRPGAESQSDPNLTGPYPREKNKGVTQEILTNRANATAQSVGIGQSVAETAAALTPDQQAAVPAAAQAGVKTDITAGLTEQLQGLPRRDVATAALAIGIKPGAKTKEALITEIAAVKQRAAETTNGTGMDFAYSPGKTDRQGNAYAAPPTVEPRTLPDPIAPTLTAHDLARSIPGAWTVDTDTGLEVRIPAGKIEFKTTDIPKPTRQQAESEIGRPLSDAEYDQIYAAGSFQVVTVSGKKYGVAGLVKIQEGVSRPDKALGHELVHVASPNGFGLYSPKEWGVLTKRFAPGETDTNVIEEKIAQGAENTPVKQDMFSRLGSWVRGLLDRVGLGKLSPVRAEDVLRTSKTEAFWQRNPQPGVAVSKQGNTVQVTGTNGEGLRSSVVRHSLKFFTEGKDVNAPEILDAMLADKRISPEAIQKFKERAAEAGVSKKSIQEADSFLRRFNGVREVGQWAILPGKVQGEVILREGVLNTPATEGFRRERLDKLYKTIEAGDSSVQVGRLVEGGADRSVIPKEVRGLKPNVFLNIPITQSDLSRPRPESLNYPVVVTGNPHLTNFKRPHPSWDASIKVVRVKPVFKGSAKNVQAVTDAINYANEIGAKVLVTTFRSHQLWQLASVTDNIVPTNPADPRFSEFWKPNPTEKPSDYRKMPDWTPWIQRGTKVADAFKAAGWDTPRSREGQGSVWWWPESKALDPRILEKIDPETELEFCDLLHKGCTSCRNCQKLTYPASTGAPIFGVTDEPFCEHGCPQCFARGGQSGVKGRKGVSVQQNAKQAGFGDSDFGDTHGASISILQGVARDPGNSSRIDYLTQFAKTDRSGRMDMATSLYLDGKITPLDLRAMQAEITNETKVTGKSLPIVGQEKFSLRTGPAQIETPEFKQWFGKSKVVDEDGKPRRVFHGTGNTFTEFKRTKGQFGGGIYFTDSPDTAGFYANHHGSEAPQVKPVYLAIQNPFYIDSATAKALPSRETLMRRGHDGIIGKTLNGTVEYVAFHPHQIKSATGNRGTFSIDDADIRHSLRFRTPEDQQQTVPQPMGKQPRDVLRIASPLPQFDGSTKVAKGLLRRFFTSPGELPDPIFAEKVANNGRISRHLNESRFVYNDFKRAVKETLGSNILTQQDSERINAVLQGKATPETIPEGLRASVTAMRDHIDALSRELIASGAAQGTLQGVIESNLGFYTHRSYQIFDDPKWAKKVSAEIRNRALAFLRQEYPDRTDAEIHGALDALLNRGTEAGSPVAMLKRAKLGSKDLSIFLERKNIPEPIRELWGEYKDAGVNYTKSIYKMANLVENHRFLTRVRERGLGVYFHENPITDERGSFSHQIAVEGSNVMAPLNGLWTTKEVVDAFNRATQPEHVPSWLMYLTRAQAVVKAMKTVGSASGHVRNVMGNPLLSVAAGHWNVSNAATSFQAIRAMLTSMNSEQWRNYILRAAELGLIGEDAAGGEFRDAIKRSSRNTEEFLFNSQARAANKIVEAGRMTARGMVAMYQVEDAFFKLHGWECEKAAYAKAYPNKPMAEIEQIAAEHVRNIYPTNSMVPEIVRKLSRFPLVGTFVTFSAEVIRCTANNLALAKQELATPETRAIGARRMAGSVVALLGPAVLGYVSKVMVGMSPDDEKDFRKFVPDWQKNSTFIHFGKNSKGEFRYIDLAFSNPFSVLTDPVTGFMNGSGVLERAGNAAGDLKDTFLGEDILFKAFTEVWRNSKDKGGQVYNPSDTPAKQVEQIAAHLYPAFEPGTVTSLRRIKAGVEERVSKSGKAYNPYVETAAFLGGQRIQDMSIAQSLEWKLRGYQRQDAEIDSIFTLTAGNRGTTSGAEVAAAYQRMEGQRRKAFDALRENISAARRLGVTEQQISAMFKMLKIPKADTVSILSGKYQPFKITQERVGSMQRANPADFQDRIKGLKSVISRP